MQAFDFYTPTHIVFGPGIGVPSGETIQELAYRCAFQNTRTIGTFRVLDHYDILKIYQAANH